ncbi:MAG TPA: DNA-3-methyladenine glycosylase [Pyrinomonadaceae bacterium]|nr:DNA-3-methyladenine glycosylase [Pyrinomonadaceae bacterium]
MKLRRGFYTRADVLTLARALLGKRLVVPSDEGARVSGRIVETEAYLGAEDKAAHSYRNRRTARTETMFAVGGTAYVFFVYGMHWHVNLVTTRAGAPHAVLIRAIEPLEGLELMAARRGVAETSASLTNGPGKVCQAFGIGAERYGVDLCRGPLVLIDGPRGRIGRSPRIGVDYAGEWAARPWRFFERENRYVSRPRGVTS